MTVSMSLENKQMAVMEMNVIFHSKKMEKKQRLQSPLALI